MSANLDELQALINSLHKLYHQFPSERTRRAADALTALRDEVIALRKALQSCLEKAEFNKNRVDDSSILRGRLLSIQDVVRAALQST